MLPAIVRLREASLFNKQNASLCNDVDAGAAPLFFNQRAIDKLKGRKTKVASYYLDLNLVGAYCKPLQLLASPLKSGV